MYKSLQAGRAFAAIFVVLHHLGGTIALEKYFGIKEFGVPFLFGNAGVEFFLFLVALLYAQHIVKTFLNQKKWANL